MKSALRSSIKNGSQKKPEVDTELENLRAENALLRKELMKDDLTGLYNARCLRERLESCISERLANKERPSLLFIDVDHFKAVNESHGHMAAGAVLRRIGELISRIVRHNDVAFRYGGDEFVVLVNGGELGARQVGERIRKAVEKHVFLVRGLKGEAKVRVTVSLGMRVIATHDKVEDILEAADRAMYEAKRNSRNTLMVA